LLEASMEITTYNNHRSAPFSRALVDKRNQVYSAEGSRRPYPIIFRALDTSFAVGDFPCRSPAVA
jgi:hypothetical protein